MADVEIPIAQGTLPAYLSEPEGDRPRPGVVVVHDAFGMTPDVRRQADWLAGAGFLAVAPDLYSWDKRGRCVRATLRALLSGTGRAFDELDATRAWLAGRRTAPAGSGSSASAWVAALPCNSRPGTGSPPRASTTGRYRRTPNGCWPRRAR
ncbi:dienelactone hydrolase family protein [Micromonospora sp. 4G55]|nr:dienelactone hydrolase family protein [Micromonospora sp. 4G55]